MSNEKEPFSQLSLQFTDPIQYDYEVIRPIVLYGQTITQRSDEVDLPRSTVSAKAKRFVQAGMLGLIDQRTQPKKKKPQGFPEPIARYIVYLKQVYPAIHYREIGRIIKSKFGYSASHGKIKRFLQRNRVTVQLELKLEQFHEFEDAYEARWSVVRMYHEGWNKKSIAAVLKLSRTHVTTLIQAFDKDGFDALEDQRSRPENHPDNQMTLPFIEKVFRTQLAYPDAGRFRIHGILEQHLGEETPSERTVGRAMAHNRNWRGAPNPLKDREPATEREPVELPYKPLFHHQYWFIDIRYLVKLDGKWIYSICIIEGLSRAILAGMASRYQDEVAILQLLHAAFNDFGLPWGIVSDNGSVFTADAFMRVLDGLSIEPCPIESRQAWQNLIESQFNIQRRLADAKFIQSESFAEIQDHHAAFIQLFNTIRHWAHRHRTDDRLTPIAVLNGQSGRPIEPHSLQHVFRHLQYARTVNQHGLVSIQRFYIYAERGLSQRRVTVWLYNDRLNISLNNTLLARYTCSLQSNRRQLNSVSNPTLFDTLFASPQQELFILDDTQWLKVLKRPAYLSRQPTSPSAFTQLALLSTHFAFWLWLLPFS